MALFAPIYQLPASQLATLSLAVGALGCLPFLVVPVRLVYSYRRANANLTLRLLFVAVLLLPGALDSLIGGAQEYLCYNSASSSSLPALTPAASCAFATWWRLDIVWVFETSATVAFIKVTLDRYVMMADNRLIYLPARLRQALFAAMLGMFGVFLGLMAGQSRLPAVVQEYAAMPVYAYAGCLDIALGLATLRATLRIRRSMLDKQSRMMLNDTGEGAAASILDTASMAAAPAAGSSVVPARRRSTMSKLPTTAPLQNNRTAVLARAKYIIVIVSVQLFLVVINAMVLLSPPPFQSLVWAIGIVQLPVLFIRAYFMLSIVYLRMLAALAQDGAQLQQAAAATIATQAW
ncbi:hypothetical protein RI367_001791 [Sorochytrium milnesiophthora]